MAFLWDKKLETGNGMIDQQHKQLITAINDLLQACSSRNGKEEFTKKMKFIYDYT